jgi:hypothetical protein
MTFEEFFTKKKIDLVQLEKAEPSLFVEFKSHFNLMGEKSFDHTKKFWFNKLRHLYRLSSPDKATTKVETKIASQAEPLNSPTIEQALPLASAPNEISQPQPVVKPAFRPRNIPVKAEEKKTDEPTGSESLAEQLLPSVKKPGFKPRNIPAANKEAEDVKSLDSRPGENAVSAPPVVTESSKTEATAAKPAYKPKFNLKNLPKTSPTGDTIDEIVQSTGSDLATEKQEDRTETKPAYKPKFNLKNIPKVSPKEEINENENRVEKEIVTDIKETEAISTEEAGAPKPTYKPKFNLKNLPKVVQNGESAKGNDNDSADDKGTPNEETPSIITPSDEGSASSPKPVYKPKFNIKNLPKASSKDEVSENEEVTATEANPGEAPTTITPEKENPLENEGIAQKPAYKPRFNMKNLPKVKQTEDEEKPATEEIHPKGEAIKNEGDVTPEPAPKPAGYKPKFALRNIQPKPPQE